MPNLYRQGDVLLVKIKEIPKTAKELKTNIVLEGEAMLDCGCHKIDKNGNLYSCLEQKSIKRKQGIITKKTNKWKLLKGTITKNGYKQTILHGKIIRINRLIANHFLPNPNNLPEVQHINGNKLDNRIKNLKWGNQKENALDREKHGHTVRGSNSPNAKINEDIAKQIFNSKLSLLQTAKQFNVSKKLVLLIKQGKIWKHIHKNKLTLLYGEITSHRHLLETNGDIKVIKKINQFPVIFSITRNSILTHPEHKTIEIPKGNYEVTRQREYDPYQKAIQSVTD